MTQAHSIACLHEVWAKDLMELAHSRLPKAYQDPRISVQIRRAINLVLPRGANAEAVERVGYALSDLNSDDEFRRSDPLLASLLRLEKEMSVDLLSLIDYKLTPEAHIYVRQAMGVIAMAWQYHQHPEDVILSVKTYRKRLEID